MTFDKLHDNIRAECRVAKKTYYWTDGSGTFQDNASRSDNVACASYIRSWSAGVRGGPRCSRATSHTMPMIRGSMFSVTTDMTVAAKEGIVWLSVHINRDRADNCGT